MQKTDIKVKRRFIVIEIITFQLRNGFCLLQDLKPY